MANSPGLDEAQRLERAADMQHQALEINQQLGSRKDMAYTYVNLGRIYQTRGDLERARESLIRARDLFSEMGVPREVEKVEGLLAGLDDD